MYAQVTFLHVPTGRMSDVRDMIAHEYLPVVSKRPGFIAAYVLEQVDDDEAAQMIQFWDNHAAVENFNRTGLLETSVQMLAVRIPGLQLRRQGYVVRVAVGSGLAEVVTAP